MYDDDNRDPDLRWNFFASEAWDLIKIGFNFLHALICGFDLSALLRWFF